MGKAARPLSLPLRNHTRITTASALSSRKSGACTVPQATVATCESRLALRVSSSTCRSLIVCSRPSISSFCSVTAVESTRYAWANAASSAQTNATRNAIRAVPTRATFSMPESGATSARSDGGTVRPWAWGTSASLDTIKADLRGRMLNGARTALFRGGVTSGTPGVTMPMYAPAATAPPDDLAADCGPTLPDGSGRGEHVEVRPAARARVRGAAAKSLVVVSTWNVFGGRLGRAAQLREDRLEQVAAWKL